MKLKTIKQLEKQKLEIDEQILEIDKQIEELKNKSTWRKFKCLPNVELSNIQDWDEPYDKIVIPKGCRLMEAWEFAKLIESEESDDFLGKYKGKFSYFWLNQSKYCKTNNFSFRVCLDSGSFWGVGYDLLEGSGGDGRVVFVRDLK